jgi:hypothetical protein
MTACGRRGGTSRPSRLSSGSSWPLGKGAALRRTAAIEDAEDGYTLAARCEEISSLLYLPRRRPSFAPPCIA